MRAHHGPAGLWHQLSEQEIFAFAALTACDRCTKEGKNSGSPGMNLAERRVGRFDSVVVPRIQEIPVHYLQGDDLDCRNIP